MRFAASSADGFPMLFAVHTSKRPLIVLALLASALGFAAMGQESFARDSLVAAITLTAVGEKKDGDDAPKRRPRPE